MSMTIWFDADLDLVREASTGSGLSTLAGLTRAVKVPETADRLVDLSRVPRRDVTAARITELAAGCAEGVRVAVVVPLWWSAPDGAVPDNVRVFRRLSGAVGWLRGSAHPSDVHAQISSDL